MHRVDPTRRLPAFAISIAFLALLAVAPPAGADDRWGDPRSLRTPEMRAIQVPQPARVELPNGLVILLLENHDFPVVDVRALLEVGSVYDPPDKVGLASITGEVMRTGGSLGSSGDELDLVLEGMGASAEISIGQTRGAATLSTLAEDAEAGIEILADLLRHPAFPQEKIDLAKGQARTAIASRNDQPLPILTREFQKIIFGPEHPYARHEEYATIEAITRADLEAFHREHFHPDRMILTVYGDFDRRAIESALRRAFEEWKPSGRPAPPLPEVTRGASPGVFLIEKSDMTQSGVMIGQPSLRLDDPDYPELEVFSQILGGGFSSRLFNEIRTQRGLAYSAGTSLGAEYERPGIFTAYAITQADSTVRTLGYVRRNLEDMLAAPVTPQELARAKDSVLNSLVFDLSSRPAVLARLADYESFGYAPDFLQRYQEAIKSVSAEEIQQAARRRIRSGDLAVMLIGNPDRFREGLASLGEVQVVDITIPEADQEVIPEGTEADFARGQELMAAAARAAGADALARLRDVEVSEEGIFTMQGREIPVTMETKTLLPECQRVVQRLPFGALTMAVCGDEAWMEAGGGVEDAPADMVARAEADRPRELVSVLTRFAELRLQPLESAMVDGRPADVLYVHHPTVKGWKIYLDAETREIVRMDYRDRSPFGGGPVHAEERLSDYRAIDGLRLPHQRVIRHDGQPFATITASSIRVNTGATREDFARPAR